MSSGYGQSGWGDPLVTTPDPFDNLLNHVCDIYRITGGSVDKYGQPVQFPVRIAATVPCRISSEGKSNPTPGDEYKTAKEVAMGHYKVFMREQEFQVHPALYLVIESRWLNILSVNAQRARLNDTIHHLECRVEEVLPSFFTPPPVQ